MIYVIFTISFLTKTDVSVTSYSTHLWKKEKEKNIYSETVHKTFTSSVVSSDTQSIGPPKNYTVWKQVTCIKLSHGKLSPR